MLGLKEEADPALYIVSLVSSCGAMPGQDVLQPQDPVEPAAAVGGGGGPGRGQHRPGGRGYQLDTGRAQAAAGRRVAGVERTLCTLLWR